MQPGGTRGRALTELSGTLEGVGLPAIVRFLSGLGKTGCLRITYRDWRGDLFFEEGRITCAMLGARQGPSVLDALVQAFPDGSFTFEVDARAPVEPNLDLSQDDVQARLDDLAGRAAAGAPTVPTLDCVLELVEQAESNAAEEPLALDRAALQTLLAVDGRRSTREIVAQRGSVDALWQLGRLLEVGLVRVREDVVEEEPRVPVPVSALPAVHLVHEAPVADLADAAFEEAAEGEVVGCPKLGFEDDPHTAFGRPTRLHRCFAAGSPLPLSLDQQRELCLSEQYGGCPRLAMLGEGGEPHEAAEEDSRIVRLPFVGRAVDPDPHVAAQASPSHAPTPAPAEVRAPQGAEVRAAGNTAPARFRNPAPAQQERPNRPTPLRSRIARTGAAPAAAPAPTVSPLAAANTSSSTRAPAGPSEPVAAPLPRHVAARAKADSDAPPTQPKRPGLLATLPVRAVAVAAMALITLAFAGFIVATRFDATTFSNPFADDSDTAGLPNTSAAAAGTPIAQLTLPRSTPASVVAQRVDGATSAATPAAPAPTPTVQAAASANGLVTLLDENFRDNSRNWPNNQQGTAWLSGGSYRLSPRRATEFVALSVPIPERPSDTIVTASFRKVGGPAGGGYGIIVRGQEPLDGSTQNGRYYVLEVGDKGEVGMWRRDTDHWVDLLPWQHSDAVRAGAAVNEVSVRAFGSNFTLLVNGTEVATRTDATLSSGGIGLFAGGDGNQVAVDHVSVQTPGASANVSVPASS